MNRRQPHKVYSEKVCQSAELQDGQHKACKWLGIGQNVTWALAHTAQEIMCICTIQTHPNLS